MFAANRPLVTPPYHSFEALDISPYTFLIWNLFLTDKLTPLTYDALKAIGVAEIIAILPEEEDFKALNADIREIPYSVLSYHHKHEPVLPVEQYDAICEKIDTIARRPRDQKRNVLIFCNNGFQRSIPFLVYYMMKFHSDEFPSVDRAIGCIFNAIGAKNSFEEKRDALQRIQQLFII